MPIDFDDQSIDVSGVDDRRGGGMGGGLAIGGGTGIVGIIVFLLYSLLGGQSPSVVPQSIPQAQGGGATESADQLKARCSAQDATDKYTDCRLIKVYNIADDVWRAEFDRRGIEYSSPRLAFFSDATQTGCGPASAEVGPFYCPADREIYFELGFLDVLQQKFGATGEYAQAYIAAHEFGHHLQTLLGIEPQVRQIQQRNPNRANEFSVAMELQADCFAGVWAKKSDEAASGIILSQEDITEALNAAAAVGDDRIQAKVQGRVDPEGFTHGTAAERREWFARGFDAADIDSCNTFQSRGLTR
ncbi:MAG: neutral zinc metallopeptidase [Kineosporiaceae bacterium]|nr:neutral zinc metallopeptidase [Kineosporiaceae bacterium]